MLFIKSMILLILSICMLDSYHKMSIASPTHDEEYEVLMSRSKERLERIRNRHEGRSPAIGSNKH